ncbi:MAG: SDR family NAD(P)-dependent oxidoreductase [Candidatus Promineifilaceae bacterium]
MAKRVLVTGGAGFIGSHLADRLIILGHEVIIIDNESSGRVENIPKDAEYFLGDVRNPAELEAAFSGGLDAVFHIAGQASTIQSFDEPHLDLEVNTVGTMNVVLKCLEYEVPRLLFASSMTVYGHINKIPISESTPVRPVSYYGISKYAAERFVHATSIRNDLKKPFNVTSFRMFNVYGSRQRLDNPYQGVMGIFIGNALRDEPIVIYGDGEQSRDFVFIEDVVEAWLAALESPSTYNQVINLGIGQDCTVNRLVDMILDGFGHSRKLYRVDYQDERPGDQRKMRADIQKANTLLGWGPKVDLQDGIKSTIAWAKEYA